jgi:hypothetical protein
MIDSFIEKDDSEIPGFIIRRFLPAVQGHPGIVLPEAFLHRRGIAPMLSCPELCTMPMMKNVNQDRIDVKGTFMPLFLTPATKG